jgi:tetratricopeptide (TPR) repeat protein
MPLSLGALNRWQALVAAVAAAVAAIFGVLLAVNPSPLKLAGLLTAATFAVVIVVIAAARACLETGADERTRRRRLLVPVRPVSKVDPTKIGVDPAPQTVLAGKTLPEYLQREVDVELREAIDEAHDGRGPWLVVVLGPPKVGKSRTLFEALRACDSRNDPRRRRWPIFGTPERHDGLNLVAPKDGDAVEEFAQGEDILPAKQPAVLWLDDLEPFLPTGVTWTTLEDWRKRGQTRFVVATYGGKRSQQSSGLAGRTDPGINDLGDNILARARKITLKSTTSDELEPLREKLAADFETARQYGLAAYLVAGDRLETRLDTEASPEGVAVIDAAADWARCGRTDAISEDTLRHLWRTYLPVGVAPSDDGFAIGRNWALDPVAGRIALLQQGADGYRAYDYVVELISNRPEAGGPPDPVWAAAIETALPTEAFAVGAAASSYGRWADAVEAFTRARESSVDQYAAAGGVNLGVALAQLGRSADALAAYQQVIDRYRDDPAPALRVQVARALTNQGFVLGEVDPSGAANAPELRKLLARAQNNQGLVFPALGSSADALAAFQQVIARYGNDPAPALRKQVARALNNQGLVLCGLVRYTDAVAAFQQVIDHYGNDPAPELREQVAMAQTTQRDALDQLDQFAHFVVGYQQAIDRYGNDPAPELREEVAMALNDQGYLLGERGQFVDALAALQQVIDRYGDDPAPELRELVALALNNQGYLLSRRGKSADALAAFQQVIARCGPVPAPELRELVALALDNRAFVLAELGWSADALAGYHQVIDRYPDDLETTVRALVELRDLLEPVERAPTSPQTSAPTPGTSN